MGLARRRLIAGAISAVLFVVVAAAGCGVFGDSGAESPPPRAHSTPASVPSTSDAATAGATPDAGDVDLTDPSAVCDAFADTLFSGDPVTEDQNAPLRRATTYVSPRYQEQFLRDAPRLSDWDAWEKAGATQLLHMPARYVGEKPKQDTQNRQYRVAGRRVVPADSQGNPVGQTYGFVVYCTLVDVQGRWLVADHTQDAVDPAP